MKKTFAVIPIVVILSLVAVLVPFEGEESDGAISVTIDGLQYSLSSGSATVVDVIEDRDEWVIPSEVYNAGVKYTVETIGSKAFQGSTMTSLTIPSTVSSMGSQAFRNCTNLGN